MYSMGNFCIKMKKVDFQTISAGTFNMLMAKIIPSYMKNFLSENFFSKKYCAIF
jgi:hypothetical protein